VSEASTVDTAIEQIARHLEQIAAADRGLQPPDWITQDLTFGQLRVLLVVQREGPVSIGALADRLRVSLASASETIDRLERHGLVLRQHRTDDRRVVECRLSADGERLVEAIAGLRLDAMRRMLGVLDPTELVDFDRLLQIIAGRLRASDPTAKGTP
jgi:DNA-binding MarR family transcriptional regulator